MTLMATLPFALTAYAVAPGLGLSALALFVVGLLYLGALSSFTTIAQLRVASEIRGRVLERVHGDPRLALPARRDRAGQDRRPHRPARGRRSASAVLMLVVLVVTRARAARRHRGDRRAECVRFPDMSQAQIR